MEDSRKQQLIDCLRLYSQGPTHTQFSIANFRIVNNILDEEFEWLEDTQPDMIKLLITKQDLNLHNRLLANDVTSSEVAAIKLILESSQVIEAKAPTSININFARTNDELISLESSEVNDSNDSGSDNQEI